MPAFIRPFIISLDRRPFSMMGPPTGQRAFLGAFLLISYNVGTCIAWLAAQHQPSATSRHRYGSLARAPTRPFLSRIRMSAADDENDDDGELDDRERMKTIRALQDAFYSSGAEEGEVSSACRVEPDGSIASLPLWRVSWTELPGRSNVLIVHEARYTHMFEQVIRNGQMLFGHLRLPGGSNSIGKEGYELLSWKDEADIMLASQASDKDGNEGSEAEYCYTDDVQEHSSCRSACVGTLMKIVDYRRMSDGKMLLLVHALDRFVVSKPIQELPFSIADVQLLPDSEEMEYVLAQQQRGEAKDKMWYSALNGSDVMKARRTATSNSLKWQQYEFDDTVKLPVRSDGSDDLTPSDVVGTALKSVVPHVPFASSSVPSKLSSNVCTEDISENTNCNDNESSSSHPSDSVPMEKLLIDSGILLGPSEPDPNRRRSAFTIEQLERELWIFVNEWVQANNAMSSFPPELLALLPPLETYEWPDDFILEDLATTMAATSELKGSRPFVRITEDYPAHRRRRRLSYVISALTDHTPFGRGMPPILLEIHSTRDKLEAMCDVFEFVNTEKMGEFN